MRVILKSHNDVAYKKVMATFKHSNRTCVCHPTGTGKSYIVAAVTEHFDKVLILAPNNFVLRQQQSVIPWRKDIEYYSYIWLMLHVTDITEHYDLIVLDEFHRTGADVWGAAVNLLLESQPQAKVLGTTATPIRYSDDNRDMSTELFNGNVASVMTIADAWRDNILPIPIYVTGFFNFDKLTQEVSDRISRSQQLDEERKRQNIFRINNMRLDWEKAYGVKFILTKHMPKDLRRVIVFCAHIDTLKDMRHTVSEWFWQAGFKVAGSYIIHSDQSEIKQSEQMTGFESNDGDGVRLMFAVNILNEGIHVPDVDAVIMLRTTESRIVYMQQMGRCLTAANSSNPVVLDLVDNITTTTAIRDFADEFNRVESDNAEKEHRQTRHFEVIDYTLDIRQVIDMLVPCHKSLEEKLKKLEDYYALNHMTPSGSRRLKGEERKMGIMWMSLKRDHADHPIVQKYIRIEREAWRNKKENNIKAVAAFMDENHRPPRASISEDEKRLETMWHHLKKHHPEHPTIQRLYNEYGPKALNKKYVMSVLADAEAFSRKYGYQPRHKDDKELFRRWIELLRTHSEDEEVKAFLAKYPKHDYISQTIRQWEDYKRDYGHYPSNKKVACYQAWCAYKRMYPDNPKVKEFSEKVKADREAIRERAINERADHQIAFYQKNGRFPNARKENSEWHQLHFMIKKYPYNPKVKLLAEMYDNRYK